MHDVTSLVSILMAQYPGVVVSSHEINYDGFRVCVPGKEPVWISSLEATKNTDEALLDLVATKLFAESQNG